MNAFDGPIRLDMAVEIITNVCQVTIRWKVERELYKKWIRLTILDQS